MSGFIAMQREALDHPLLQDGERFRAWFWLISNASWKPTRTRIKGEIIDLQRGELSFSVRFLAERWGWSKSKVDRFLADLRAESMIETRSKTGTTAGHKAGQGQSIITICNYGKYQDVSESQRDNANAKTGTTAGQQRDKEEQRNQETKNKGLDSDVGSNTPREENLDSDEPVEFDPGKAIFDTGVPLVIASGRTPRQARTLVAKWRKEFRDGLILDAILRCRERKNPQVDPATWIAQQLSHSGPKDNRYERSHQDPDEPTNPTVRATLKRQAERAAGLR